MLRILDRLEEILIATLIAAATVIIFVAVIQRYSLGLFAGMIGFSRAHDLPWLMPIARSAYFGLRSVNLVWAQELCIILFVWMAKFGAAYGVRTGIHVGIDVLINRLQPKNRKLMVLFGLGCGALFTGIIAVLGANFVLHMYRTSSISPDLELPMWIVYLAVPLGSGLMCFRFLQVAFSFSRTGELPHIDHGHVEGMDEEAEAIADSPLTPKER
ncbi:TRAP transporter small permease [Rhizobium halophytocola]|uniref:TRAP transporter small permease protein n=1 Tax=Rhizobium halophytocola TaxID=735519 RepID=A0ABS4E3A2_9HYPH|nr:TRAP transporter small permease [Rhizobium halophytocola]MBP1852414.1 C4-dicarboxylate transporter DctQ subunit [Rhizobium halophytocola]